MFYTIMMGLITTALTMYSQEKQNESAKEMNDIMLELENAKLEQQEKLTQQGLALQEKELGLKEEMFKSQEKTNIMEMIEKRKEREFGEKTTKIGVAGGFRDEQSALRDKLTSFWGRMMPQRRAA